LNLSRLERMLAEADLSKEAFRFLLGCHSVYLDYESPTGSRFGEKSPGGFIANH